MKNLSKSTLNSLPDGVKIPPYGPDERSTGIVHIGPGAFHRAHQAVYTDMAMAHGGNWKIDAVSMRSATLKEKLAEQDNLYSLAILDNNPYTQIIGVFNQVLVLDEDRETIMDSLTADNTHIISLTITEKGYCLNSQGELDLDNPDIVQDLQSPQKPVSAIGLLAAALAVRQSTNSHQLTIISCDNLSNNGTKLGNAVVTFAAKVDTSLADWIKSNICFPNTMVDSITPATDDSLVSTISAELNVKDAWPIQRESFSQWVVEDKFSGPRPAWDKVGVTFTDDVHLFEKAKLRVLNGTHSTLAYVGSLCDVDTVFEAISIPEISAFIKKLLEEEILPTIDAGRKMDLQQYAEAILTRYHNRHIRHMLSQIAWDGSQKLPFRILNTLRDQLAAKRSIDLLCVPVAAWILFIARKQRDGDPITDPKSDSLLAIAKEHEQDEKALADAILSRQDIFAELCENAHFRDTVFRQINTLKDINRDSLSHCLNTACGGDLL